MPNEDTSIEVVTSSKPVVASVAKNKLARHIANVEFAPVFPGCEKLKTNKKRVACFQEKIQRLVSRKFNGGLGRDLGLSGMQRIHVFFEIDVYGQVQNIKARAPHPRLEEEAIRVVNKLPRMIPARQGQDNVAIQYALPIVFDVRY